MAGLIQTDSRSKAEPIPAFFLYGEPPQPLNEAAAHIETIAERSRLHGWTIQPHRHHELHQILVIQSGSVEVCLDREGSILRAPSVVVVPPGVVHGFRFEVNTVGVVVSFARGLAEELARPSSELHCFLERPQAVSLGHGPLLATDLAALSEMLLREFERLARGQKLALRGLLIAWVANVYRVSQPLERGHAGAGEREREIVTKFRDLIERLFRKHATVTDYCDALRVSPSQLRRACLVAAGVPPVALIHLRMLVEAERQLRYTTMHVTQVAHHLGFNDPAYFTRFFRRRTGLSPKAFRNRDG